MGTKRVKDTKKVKNERRQETSTKESRAPYFCRDGQDCDNDVEGEEGIFSTSNIQVYLRQLPRRAQVRGSIENGAEERRRNWQASANQGCRRIWLIQSCQGRARKETSRKETRRQKTGKASRFAQETGIKESDEENANEKSSGTSQEGPGQESARKVSKESSQKASSRSLAKETSQEGSSYGGGGAKVTGKEDNWKSDKESAGKEGPSKKDCCKNDQEGEINTLIKNLKYIKTALFRATQFALT